MAQSHKNLSIKDCPFLDQLPLYQPILDQNPLPIKVIAFREQLTRADAIVIATPEYLHNIPAALKNCLEWLTSPGTIAHKKVLAITYTPKAPRGEKAMQSLLYTLQALDTQIVSSLAMYHTDIAFNERGDVIQPFNDELLIEAFQLLIGD